jgi:hypothetical protein
MDLIESNATSKIYLYIYLEMPIARRTTRLYFISGQTEDEHCHWARILGGARTQQNQSPPL